MGGVLEHLRWPLLRSQRAACVPLHRFGVDLPALQLETAKEILSEVFNTTSSEVDDMIRQRLVEREGR